MPSLVREGDAPTLLAVGQALSAKGRPAAAEPAVRAAAAAGSTDAIGELARSLDYQGRIEEAEPIYRQAIAAGDELAILNLADMLVPNAARRQEAEALAHEAVSRSVVSAYYVLGKILARWPGREAEAAAALRAETDPQIAEYVNAELRQLGASD